MALDGVLTQVELGADQRVHDRGEQRGIGGIGVEELREALRGVRVLPSWFHCDHDNGGSPLDL